MLGPSDGVSVASSTGFRVGSSTIDPVGYPFGLCVGKIISLFDDGPIVGSLGTVGLTRNRVGSAVSIMDSFVGTAVGTSPISLSLLGS